MKRWTYLLLLLLAVALTLRVNGCGDGGSGLINEKTEISIGRDAAADLERQHGVVTDQAMNARLARASEPIAAVSGRANLPWSFKILNDPAVNAMALPGGFVYATKGLIGFVRSDAELAGVMGHEIAHVARRHSVQQIETALGAQLIIEIVTGKSSRGLQQASALAADLALKGNSREDELEADRVGTKFAYEAGDPADGLLTFLRHLDQEYGRKESRVEILFSTHPDTQKRIRRLEEYLPKLTGARPG